MKTATMTTLSRAAACAVVLAALCGTGHAAPAAGMEDSTLSSEAVSADKPLDTLKFSEVNTAADGRITVDEFKKAGLSDSLFATIDANHDGVITMDEFDSYGPVTRAKH